MMNALGVTVGVVLCIALLGAMGAGGYFGLQWVMDHWVADNFGMLDPQVATLLVIVSMVVVLCAVIIAGGFKSLGRRDTQIQVRAEKADLYERLVLIWGAKLRQPTQTLDQAVEGELQKLARLLMLRGSQKVIQSFCALQQTERETGMQSQEVRAQMAKLLLDMRRDLGRVGLQPSQQELLSVLQVEVPRSSAPVPSPMAAPQVSLSQGM